ncbi:MAG: hypothetical protein AMXMBFR53_11700 [Gemmatimonadota bacterium]
MALLPTPARPQVVIRGVVLEEGTTTPIAGATIELLGADLKILEGTESTALGWFQFRLKEEGLYFLRPSRLSYEAVRVDSVSVARNEIVTVVLRMGRAPIPLEPLVVTARSRHPLAGFYRRAESGGLGKFIHRDYIERRGGILPSRLLMMTPGIVIERTADRMSYQITMRKVATRCVPNVYLDGLPVPPGLTTIDDLTSADAIEGIEIYDSYAMAPDIFPYPVDDYCGIVAFWSRPDARRPLTWSAWKRSLVGVLVIGTYVVLTGLR